MITVYSFYCLSYRQASAFVFWMYFHSVRIIETRWPLSLKSEKPGKSQGVREERIVREQSAILNRLSELKSFTIPWVQSDDLNFYHNFLLRSQENFCEVRGK